MSQFKTEEVVRLIKKNKLWKRHLPKNPWARAFEIIELWQFQRGVYSSSLQPDSKKVCQHNKFDKGCYFESMND